MNFMILLNGTNNIKISKIISKGIIREYLAKLKLINNCEIENELEEDTSGKL